MMDRAGSMRRVEASNVINATWERRGWFDAMISLETPPRPTHRLKILAKFRLPDDLHSMPSMFFCQGPFGMVANLGQGEAIATYAPVTNYHSFTGVEAPRAWDRWTRRRMPSSIQRELGHRIRDGLARFTTVAHRLELVDVRAGIVVSNGDADPFDPNSAMHSRHRVGCAPLDFGWYTIDTGKFSYGPLLAERLARQIAAPQLEAVI